MEAIRVQMRRMGWAIDWQREVSAHEPTFYRWTQWLFLKFLEHGLIYRKEAPGQLVPVRPDGARERARRRRPLLALREHRRDAEHGAVVLQDHRRTPTSCSPTWRSSTGPRARRRSRPTGSAAPKARRCCSASRSSTSTSRSSRRVPTRCSARRSSSSRPSRRSRRCSRDRRPRRCVLRADRRSAADRGARAAREDRRLHRPLCDEPGQRRADPDLGRRLRPDGVRHGRDHGGPRARRARRRVRTSVRPADRPGDRRRREADLLGAVQRAGRAGGKAARSSSGCRSTGRRSRRSTTACATGASRASATGAPDPGHLLPRRRHRAGARGPVAGAVAGGRGLPAEGPAATRLQRRVHQRAVPEVRRAGASARPTRWTRSSTRPGTSCATPIRRTITRRSIAGSRTTGCRSTSTSAASTTRRATCSIRASSSR